MKNHLENGNIHYSYLNMRESIYDFMMQNKMKQKKL